MDNVQERRLSLQAEMQSVVGEDVHVYYQPPEQIKMVYPCVRIVRSDGAGRFANNHLYLYHQCYEVRCIDEDPDSGIFKKIMDHFPLIRYNRHMASDGLNEDILILYYN